MTMTTLQEAARDALEALERIGKDFVCRSAHHAKEDQHSAFAECPVVVRHTDAIESLRTALAQQVTLVPQEWTNLLAYALQDDMHNRLTPRVVDIAYTAFTLAKRPNAEDGGASDWFNDTKPKVTELIAKLRKDLIEEFAAASAPVAQHGEQAKPAAYITPTEQGPMVWTQEMYDEACTYCDDDEFPIPLYTVALRPTSGDYAQGYAEGFNDACKPAPQAQERSTCNHCDGTGWVARDPDIGTDQECFVCDGSGYVKEEPAPQPAQGDRVTDKAWAQFCGLMGEKAPYPGMIDAFERHYAQSFKDKDWRNEASVWAQAWKAALQSAQPIAQPLSDSEIEKLREKTFSTYNPYCPVDSKSMRKAVRAAEAAHGIRGAK